MKIPKAAKVNKKGSITYKVNVTAHDIRYGRQGNPRTCAIAQVLKREFKEQDVRVGCADIKVDGYRMNRLESKVMSFITMFDKDRKSVKPFSFIIKLIKSI